MVTFFRRRFLSCQGFYPRIKWFSRYLIQFVNSNHFEGFPGLSDLFEPCISFGFLDSHHRKHLIGTIKQTVDLFLGHAFSPFLQILSKNSFLKSKFGDFEADTKAFENFRISPQWSITHFSVKSQRFAQNFTLCLQLFLSKSPYEIIN